MYTATFNRSILIRSAYKRALMCYGLIPKSELSRKMHWYKKMSNDSTSQPPSTHLHTFSLFVTSTICRGHVHQQCFLIYKIRNITLSAHNNGCDTRLLSQMTLDREKRAKKRKFCNLKIGNYVCIMM